MKPSTSDMRRPLPLCSSMMYGLTTIITSGSRLSGVERANTRSEPWPCEIMPVRSTSQRATSSPRRQPRPFFASEMPGRSKRHFITAA